MAVYLAVLWPRWYRALSVSVARNWELRSVSTDRLHLDFRWRHLRQALDILLTGFDGDGLSPAGTEDGYCPASLLKPDVPDPSTIFGFGSGEMMDVVLVRSTRIWGSWGVFGLPSS